MRRVARIRKWLAIAASFLIIVVTCFYLYARWQEAHVAHNTPAPLGIKIQQSTQDFTLSKSEGGRTLFTVRASKAIQFKEGGRADLHNVHIVVYGKESNRFDQISGDEFEYDPRSGNIIGKSNVHIDLESNAQGPVSPDQAPPEILKNPIHVETSGLIFNQKTGNASTRQKVVFEMTQASGSGVGVTYDAHANTMVVQSAVDITTKGEKPEHITAVHAVVTKKPRQIVLAKAIVDRPDDTLWSDQATIFLQPDNTANRILLEGNMKVLTKSDSPSLLRAATGDFLLNPRNTLRSGVLTGGVTLDTMGTQPTHSASKRAFLDFGEKSQIAKVHAVDHVQMIQKPQPPKNTQTKQMELDADVVDFFLKPGNILNHADTSGRAQIVILSAQLPPPPGKKARPQQNALVKTTVTAGKFHAVFDDRNKIQSMHGEPNTKIVSTNPGQPDRVSTSKMLDVTWDDSGQVSKMVQTDNVHYTEGQREAWGQQGTYTPGDTNLLLVGEPRVIDAGMTTTANTIRMNRQSGDAFAEGNVKSTYSDLKPQPDGAMLASGDPIHVVSNSMTANRDTTLAVYTGNARLWQGPNVMQAPTITFNRNERSVLGEGSIQEPVSTLMVQSNAVGDLTPVNITAAEMRYLDDKRTAHFEGGVLAKGSDGTLISDRATAYLLPKGQTNAPAKTESGTVTNSEVPSQLDKIVADGQVVVQQPTRRGNGDHLVYYAGPGKYLLTGAPATIFDAVKGNSRGDTLTFYNRDDRVIVEGNASSPAVSQTRVNK